VVAKKEEANVVSDAERNAKARETDRGSLSIFIVAIESREPERSGDGQERSDVPRRGEQSESNHPEEACE
jgi:hypothetical protein